jgi:NAD(P)-dependent dehydrogenase (short-subunit alcohol dehydrogenase family)
VAKKPISRQVVLVTGASSGLGRAIARRAGERGAKVVVTARNAEALDNCVGEIEQAGDWVLRRSGWKAQHTAEAKPLDAPDNLCDTLPGDPGAHGRFDRQARGSTLWTRLRLLLPKG